MLAWTDAQRMAINSRRGSVLVSAAAGSGKTAVLVERVIQRITDAENPTNVERILVVTFTKDAAGEMLARISSSLTKLIKENPSDSFLKRQKMFLPNAQISTIDSFCNRIVKENCQMLDILPDFKILQSNESELLEKEILSQVLDEIYDENSDEANALLQLFTNGKNDQNLINSILSVYKFSISSVNPEKWIDKHFDYYFENVSVENTVWGQYCLKRVKNILEHILVKCDKILLDGGDDNKVGVTAKDCLGSAMAEMKYAVELIENGGKWDEIKAIVDGLKLQRFGTFKDDEKDSHFYEINGRCLAIKKDFKSLSSILTCYADDFQKDIEYLRPIMSALKKCVYRFIELFTDKKREKNTYDYSDILHMALKLLVVEDENGNLRQTELAAEMSEMYDEILIDEFQDTNEAQDALFNAISKNSQNLFFVGDVKQSIYRFRQAMPEIFIGYKDKYENYVEELDNYPAKIALDRNFRSRNGIVEGVNFFFDYLMTRKMGEIDYKNGDRLVYSADYEKTDDKDVYVRIVSGTESKKSNFNEEVKYVADTIKKMVESGMTVGKRGEERPVRYSDICILMRNLKSHAEETVAGLAELGIPAHYEKKKGFFDNSEIVTMIAFLNIIGNPVQDIPLISVMLSPMFPFDEDDLARMRCNNRKDTVYALLKENYESDKKVKSFLDVLSQLRMLSVTLSVGELIRRILEITSYDSVVSAMNGGEKRVLNLQLLINYAENYEENGGHGLTGFIRYVDKLRKNNFDLEESNLVSENDDAVRLMTVHGSKGLEFPVVFIMNTTHNFGGRGGEKTIVDRTMGIGTVCYDKKRNIEFKTQPYIAVKLKNSLEELNEEIRIYYVAMTRAREKLYIVGNLYEPEEKIKAIYQRFYTGFDENCVSLSLAGNFLHWVILTMLQHPSLTSLCKKLGIMNCIPRATDSKIDFQIVQPPETVTVTEKEDVREAEADEELLRAIKEKISYTYTYSQLADLPVKYSASGINKETEALYIATESPAFMGEKELTPAQRGTLVHKFMEKCDFKAAKESVDAELQRLTDKNEFTKPEAEAIDCGKIKKFFDSGLYARIENATTFLREKEFTMAVPFSMIKPDVPESVRKEKVIVQGVIDGLIINGNCGEIIDYKTDKVSDEKELTEKYLQQLTVYKTAAKECFGLEKVEATIYSFGLNKEISVKL